MARPIKLTGEQKADLCALLLEGWKVQTLTRMFGVSPATIYRVVKEGSDDR